MLLSNASGVHITVDGKLPAPQFDDGCEDRILRIIQQAHDIATGSFELSSRAFDFASRYHLSSDRQNLLRPFQHLLTGRVLEVGAGCGALTRFIGENAASVRALEPSVTRARVCRERCRDLRNVEVYASALSEFPRERFDAVVAVGVLEYTHLTGGPSGPGDFLRIVREFLARDGVLILAIENQFGMKYLAGAPEDHTGSPYFGIEGLYGTGTAITFGRKYLDSLLRRAGFQTVQFAYPFPDYKFPRAVVFEDCFCSDPQLVSSIVRFMAAEDQFTTYSRRFSEEMAWPAAIRNGLGPDLANSFVVAARVRATASPASPRKIFVFSTRRRRPYAKATVIDLENRLVLRQHLYDRPADPEARFAQYLVDEPVLPGMTCAEGALEVINRPDWTCAGLVAWASEWAGYLRRCVVEDGDVLPSDFVDCSCFNLMRTEAGLAPFDLEWISRDDVTAGFVIFRSLLGLFQTVKSIAKPGAVVSGGVVDLIAAVLGGLGYPNSPADIERYIGQEATLQYQVAAADLRALAPVLQLPPSRHEACVEAQPGLQILQLSAENQRLAAELASAQSELSELRFHARARQAESERLDAIEKSLTWRWGLRIGRCIPFSRALRKRG